MKRGEKRPASKRGAPKLGLGAGQLSNEQISAMYSNIIQLCAQNVCAPQPLMQCVLFPPSFHNSANTHHHRK